MALTDRGTVALNNQPVSSPRLQAKGTVSPVRVTSEDTVNSKVKMISGQPGLKLKRVRSEWVCEEKVRMTDTNADRR